MQEDGEVLLKKLEENLLLKNYSKETFKSYLIQTKKIPCLSAKRKTNFPKCKNMHNPKTSWTFRRKYPKRQLKM